MEPTSTNTDPCSEPAVEVIVPTSMRAAVGERYGPPEEIVVDDVRVPEPAADQVLVRVAGASTNALDWHVVTATPFFVRAMAGIRRPKAPIPGNDVSGTVVAVGAEATRFAVGDAVFGSCWRGACAEYVAVRERDLEPVPDGVDVAEASTVGVAAFTALQAVRDQAEIQPGHRALVIGSSSGCGVFTVPLVVAAGGEVTAVCSTTNVELARSLGAHHVVDRTTTDVAIEVAAGRLEPFDVIIDLAGAEPPRRVVRSLTATGRYVMVGGRKTGHLWPLAVWPMLKLRSVFSKRTTLMFTATEPPEDRRELAALLVEGTIRPVISERVGLDGVAAAIRSHGDRTATAKILVTP